MNEREAKLYEDELARLEQACRAFLSARGDQHDRIARGGHATKQAGQTDDERVAQTYLTGTITVACARVYNLSPPGGVFDPAILFTGRPE
jgi:hypothetical protein